MNKKTMKLCPECGKEIGAHAPNCAYCAKTMTHVDPGLTLPPPSFSRPSMPRSIRPQGKPVQAASLLAACIAIVLDKTGSMEPINAQVANNLCRMVDEVEGKKLNCNLNLVIVRDIPEHGKEVGLVPHGWVTAESFKNIVTSEPCISNMTGDESQGDGLAAAALQLVDKAGKNSPNKFILLVTNSDCHVPLASGIGIEALASGLKDARITTFIIGPENSKNYELLCRSTGGLLFNVDALDEKHYTHLLKIIGRSISGSMLGSMRRA